MARHGMVVFGGVGVEHTFRRSRVGPTDGVLGPSAAKDIVVIDQLPLDPKKIVVQFVSPQCTYTKAPIKSGARHQICWPEQRSRS